MRSRERFMSCCALACSSDCKIFAFVGCCKSVSYHTAILLPNILVKFPKAGSNRYLAMFTTFKQTALTVLMPDLDPTDLALYGSSRPRSINCFLRTMHAATMAKVVRTAPIPQLNTSAVDNGSVSLITRRYASR